MEYNITELSTVDGTRGQPWGVGAIRSASRDIQTLYRGKAAPPTNSSKGALEDGQTQQDDQSKRDMALNGQVTEGEMQRRVRLIQADPSQESTQSLLPATRPDRYVNCDGTQHPTRDQLPYTHCARLHEIDRILRARSMHGVLCAPVEAPALSPTRLDMLYEEARYRMARNPPGTDRRREHEALTRLAMAKQILQDPSEMARERDTWKKQGWRAHITNTIRCPINIGGLRDYLQTSPDADTVPVNKHGIPYGGTNRQIIESYIKHVCMPTPDAQFGTVTIRYWHASLGTALVDAGLVATSREYAVPPDWHIDPFTLPKRIRSIALGVFHDVDDAGSHPNARLHMVQQGRQVVRHFIEHRNEVLHAMGAILFPGASVSEQRARVKRLFASLDMDGNVTTFANRWALQAEAIRSMRLQLADGTTFQMHAYLTAQYNATQHLTECVERNIGMSSYVTAWLNAHKPGKPHPERTVKSYCLQEAESTSRTAKLDWCHRNGHAVVSLQHDGLIIAFAQGTDERVACASMQQDSTLRLGYHQECELKAFEMPNNMQQPDKRYKDHVELQVQRIGSQAAAEGVCGPHAHDQRMWRGIPEWDREQYTAQANSGITADPVLRLHARHRNMEAGDGVQARGGVSVHMDRSERTVMATIDEGTCMTCGMTETRKALMLSLDLHAYHHFTHAAAVDGSCMEHTSSNGTHSRSLAYGVYEGTMGITGEQLLWGASLPADLEIADAEMHAIYAYLHDITRREGDEKINEARVLIQSDCLSVLDAIETAWRSGQATRLSKKDRGALLEGICRLRNKMDRVVFLFTPSHKGIAPNAYADAAAKSHLTAPRGQDDSLAMHVVSKPSLYRVRSDFDAQGRLHTLSTAATSPWILWDRSLFKATRKRSLRWVHTQMMEGAKHVLLDTTFIGRRGHTCESATYAAVTKLGLKCDKLSCKESEPVERMAMDLQRVSIVMAARNGKTMGVRGTHDTYWKRAYRTEVNANVTGWATRHGAKGCVCCEVPIVHDTVCPACNGWTASRAAMRKVLEVCTMCGLSTQTVTSPVVAERLIAPRNIRRHRELRPEAGPRWVGFAGLARTVTERLIQSPTDDAAPPDITQLAPCLADMRHVLGGQCEAGTEYAAAKTEMIKAVVQIEHSITQSGGAYSSLHGQVRRAHSYLTSAGTHGSPADDTGWEALRSMVACDAPKPDWPLPGGLTEKESKDMLTQVDKKITAAWMELLVAAHEIRVAWQMASAVRAKRRANFEAGREVVRVVLRAWREAADTVRAGAAKWDHHWYSSAAQHRSPLAARLYFPVPSQWPSSQSWNARVLLAWMRLVRARTVHRQRMHSASWRRLDDSRRRAACGMAAPLGYLRTLDCSHCHEACPQCAHDVKTDNACTSGAAAVHLRRGKRSIPQNAAATQQRNVRPRVATGQTGEQGDGTHDADRKRKRHSDAQLVYSNRSLSKLQKVVGQWYPTMPPFGDG